MSVASSLIKKSPSKSEVREGQSKIRVSDVKLSPDDEGSQSAVYDCQSRDDVSLSKKLSQSDSKQAHSSNSSVPIELEDSVKCTTQSEEQFFKDSACTTQFNADLHVDIFSGIILPQSTPPLPNSVTACNRPFFASKSSDKIVSLPGTKTFQGDLPHFSPENSPDQSSSTSPTKVNSPSLQTSLTDSHKFNTSFFTMSSMSDIPLPDQCLDYIPPPLPKYEPKCQLSDLLSSEEVQIPHIKGQEGLYSSLQSSISNCKHYEQETVGKSEENTDDTGKNYKKLPQLVTSLGSSSVDLNEKNVRKDESRYSPSKMESDEDTQEFTTVKPKVLGKEQAKKRLMAFSLSKQPNSSVMKKQNKLIVSNKISKEKPPNPNKSAGVQEQFRATISAIEEEKKRMMKNMPNYLFLYRNNLSKLTNTVIPNPTLTEKICEKDDSVENARSPAKNIFDRDDKEMNKNKYAVSSPSKSRSLVQRRSSSRRSNSQSRRYTRERECSNKKDNDDAKELKQIESLLNWKDFFEAGLELDSEFRRLKSRLDDKQKRRERRRSRSPDDRSDYMPVFNYLKKESKLMTALQAKPFNSGVNTSVSFQEKTIKYTLTKPMITWAENPLHATDFFMPKQMLLENCDKNVSYILYDIMEQRSQPYMEPEKVEERLWYPEFNYLMEIGDDLRDDGNYGGKGSTKFHCRADNVNDESGKVDDKSNKLKRKRDNSEKIKHSKLEYEISPSSDPLLNDEGENGKGSCVKSRKRRVSLVNDDYLSDAGSDKIPVKEVLVGNVKVQLDMESKRVKVRSKWDSDYEGEDNERDQWDIEDKVESMQLATPVTQLEATAIGKSATPKREATAQLRSTFKALPDDSVVNTSQGINDISHLQSVVEPKATLVSEYEEFMKMVAFETASEKNAVPGEIALENVKGEVIRNEQNLSGTPNKKIETTDWDQDSDREEKPVSKQKHYIDDNTADSFSLLPSKYDSNECKRKESPARKKSGKGKSKEKVKKVEEIKKRKYKGKSSSESSSDTTDSESASNSESDSDSDSDSDSESDSSDSERDRRKRRKRKIKKTKKKRYSSSSESDSRSPTVKRKQLKKKKNKSKISVSRENSGTNEEAQTTMLKQLDYKKQKIMKTIEEIDSAVTKVGKKKGKRRGEKCVTSDKSSDSEDREKSAKKKKKKTNSKREKHKMKGKDAEAKKSKSSKKLSEDYSDKYSESDMDNSKERKLKKKLKKPNSSESDSEGDEKENRRGGKFSRNVKGTSKKKKKKLMYSSSSESDTDSDSDSSSSQRKVRRKRKRRKSEVEKVLIDTTQNIRDWNDHLLSDGPDYKNETTGKAMDEDITWKSEKGHWGTRGSADRNAKEHKDLGDWEASSPEESPVGKHSRDSSWDEELPKSNVSNVDKLVDGKKKQKGLIGSEVIHDDKHKFLNDFNLDSKHDSIFNDSSLTNLGQDVSRDLYSSENSASMQLFPSLSKDSLPADSTEHQSKRNFKGIGDDFKTQDTNPSKEELYSPGHTDSEMSDQEDKNQKIQNKAEFDKKGDIYDPLNSDSDSSAVDNKIQLNNIPLPDGSEVASKTEATFTSSTFAPTNEPTPKADFIALPFASRVDSTQVNPESASEKFKLTGIVTKKPMISVKLQQKFQSKVASVFQSDSEEETVDAAKKDKAAVGEVELMPKAMVSTLEKNTEKVIVELVEQPIRKDVKDEVKKDEKKKTEGSKGREMSRDRSRERQRRHRARSYNSDDSLDRCRSDKSDRHVSRRRRSHTPDSKRIDNEDRYTKDPRRRNCEPRDKSRRERASQEKDSRSKSPNFKSEIKPDHGLSPKKSDEDPDTDTVRPIPVLTGLDVRNTDGLPWDRCHLLDPEGLAYSCDRFDLMHPNQLDSYKLYGSHKSDDNSMYRYNRDYNLGLEGVSEFDLLPENKTRKYKRKTRSRSMSPRKRRRSKTPDRRRSPRNRSPRHRSSISPRRRGRSPYSPRRRGSPRRKSPSRRYRSSRSPERKKSRSPRKRRHSPSRRSRSVSPRKHRSRLDSPRRRSISPKDGGYPIRDLGVNRNLIPIIGGQTEDGRDTDLSPMTHRTPKYDSPMGFSRSLADSTISDSELNNTFFNRDYPGEYASQNYPDELPVRNLITIQNHDPEKRPDSPRRLTLDQRIEIELRVPGQDESYQSYQQFSDVHTNQYSNSYACDNGIPHSNSNGNQNFYPHQSGQINSEFNGQFFNSQQPLPNFGQFHQYTPPSTPAVQNSVLQVGNIMEVVPTVPSVPPQSPMAHSQGHQIRQVGNVLQVVPSPKSVQSSHIYGPPPSQSSAVTPVSTATNVKGSAPFSQSTAPTAPSAEALINPLIKAIQLEREKRRKEKEKRRAEREARRKARQLRREAKLLSVNEKLKKSVQDEGLMLGQEVEEDELLDDLEHPSPPVPVEIITDSSQNSLPPAGKGILITAGFIPKPSSEKKEVKFADGVCPGDGTSTSGGEDRASPPPKPKLPKERRYKKKKTKVKKKVKVQIIRQVVQDDEDEDVDDLSPPPPPPGDPPPVFFARFPFGSKAQYPVYQTQTTTTTLTTVQFPTQSYQ